MRRAILLLALVACDTPPNEIDMRLRPHDQLTCNAQLVNMIRSVRIEADGNDPMSGTCVLDSVCVRIDNIGLGADITDVDAQISQKLPTLLDVPTDRLIQMGVLGYASNDCTGATYLICGRSNVAEANNGVLTVTVVCDAGGLGPDSCQGFPAGDCP